MRLIDALSQLRQYKTDGITRDAIDTVLEAIENSIDLDEWSSEESEQFPDLVNQMLRDHYKIVNNE